MKKLLKVSGIVLGCLLFLFIVLFLIFFSRVLLPIKTSEFNIPEQQYISWDEVFSRPVDLSVEELLTGWANVDLYSMIKEDSPDRNLIPKGVHPMSISAFYVKHNVLGDILIDTGLNDSFSEKPDGDYTLFMRLLSRLVGLEMVQDKGFGIESHIESQNIIPQIVLLTHLHSDHFTGLPSLMDDNQIVFGEGELNSFVKAGGGNYLSSKTNLQTLDFSKSNEMYPFYSAIDLFGDGSIWAISTPGHSPNHISYLINSNEGPILVLGDAASFGLILNSDLELSEVGATEEAYSKMEDSLDRIRTFIQLYPDCKILFSHDFVIEL